MSKERFEARVEGFLPVTMDSAWHAFATGPGFSQVYEGITVEGDWKVGGAIVWSGEWEGKAFRDEGVILSYDRPRLFAYTYWTPFWGVPRTIEHTQTIANTFESVAGGTKVVVTQSNIASRESRDQSVKNWNEILKKMEKALQGTPS